MAAAVVGFAFWFRDRIFLDFRLCYAAAWMFRQGQNPYDNNLFSATSGEDFPFSYPLPTTVPFIPLSRLDYSVAAMIWFVLAVVLLSTLVICWWRSFTGPNRDSRFLVLALLIFNLAVPKTLITGNIVVIETCLLWIAFSFLVRGKTWVFAIVVVVAASFKLSPLFFLILLLLHPAVRKWKPAIAGVALFGCYLGLSYAIAPQWFAGYRANVLFNVKDWTAIDYFSPSIFALSRRVVSTLSPTLPPNNNLAASTILYAIIIIPVLITSWKVITTSATKRWAEIASPLILFVTLVFGLISPRLSDYGYILFIPAALYATLVILKSWQSIAFAAASLLPLPFISFPEQASGDFFFGAWGYWSLLVLFASWLLFVWHLSRMRDPDEKRRHASKS
jgi:hypothetical protein